MKLKDIFFKDDNEDPLDLDWGQITVDSLKDTTAIHVFNSDLKNKFCKERTKLLIVNKYRYYKKYLPLNCMQEFTLDIRGQNISEEEQNFIKHHILKEIEAFDDNLNISISFLE